MQTFFDIMTYSTIVLAALAIVAAAFVGVAHLLSQQTEDAEDH